MSAQLSHSSEPVTFLIIECSFMVFFQIRDFPLESMHLIDGGVVPRIVKLMTGKERPCDNEYQRELESGIQRDEQAPESRHVRRTRAHVVRDDVADRHISKWGPCTPMELERRNRGLKHVAKWKMNEGRSFLFYLALPLLYVMGLRATDEFTLFAYLLLGTRLLSGSRLDGFPQVCSYSVLTEVGFPWKPIMALTKCTLSICRRILTEVDGHSAGSSQREG